MTTEKLVFGWTLISSNYSEMAAIHNIDPAMARRHHCPLGINDPPLQGEACPFRWIVFQVENYSQNGGFSY
jgi:hypothetical protein